MSRDYKSRPAGVIKNYSNILNTLKSAIKEARLRSVLTVNTALLQLYWQIDETINEQEKTEGWGAKIVEILSKDLSTEFLDMKGFSVRDLRYMREFAVAYPRFAILQVPLAKLENKSKNNQNSILQAPLAKLQSRANKRKNAIVQAPLAQLQNSSITQMAFAQLTWYHHITLLDKIKEPATRLFYIQKTIENGWSRNVMVHQIETKLHKLQGKTINNFKLTLPKQQSDLVNETFKNPYIFEYLTYNKMANQILQRFILMEQIMNNNYIK